MKQYCNVFLTCKFYIELSFITTKDQNDNIDNMKKDQNETVLRGVLKMLGFSYD